jgi:hypothetical protein
MTMKTRTRHIRRSAFAIAIAAGVGLLLGARAEAATLLLQYTFDDAAAGSTAAAQDTGEAPAANGAFVGSATRIANTPGGGAGAAIDLSLTAGSNYVSGGDANKLDGLSALTLSTWINIRGSASDNDRLMSKMGSSPYPGFDWRITGSSGNRLQFSTNTASGAESVSFDFRAVENQERWLFLAVTFDSSTGEVTTYFGDEATTASQLGDTVMHTNGAPLATGGAFRVGSTNASSSDRTPPFWFDDVRVYDGALSLAEIQAVQQEALTTIPTPAALPAGLLLIGAMSLRRCLA